ncbi:MAG: hypothetical protein ACYDA9_14690 [Terriglobia bacterium]
MSGIFFFVGIGVLTGGVFSARKQFNIPKNWPKVDATVIKIESNSSIFELLPPSG